MPQAANLPFQFASLGSGSEGNATVIRTHDACVLVDCGFSYKKLCERMPALELEPCDIDAILVTHEHADHIRGVGPTARKLNIPVYLTDGTAQTRALGRLPRLEILQAGDAVQFGELLARAHGVPHDAREPVQFTFHYRGLSLGLLTDVGSIPDDLLDAFRRLHGLILEANHDVQMLAYGPYPPGLKQRVGGHFGHLSNEQCRYVLDHIDWSLLQHLVIAHVSQKNNSAERVTAMLDGLPLAEVGFEIACQERGFTWRTLTSSTIASLAEPAAACI